MPNGHGAYGEEADRSMAVARSYEQEASGLRSQLAASRAEVARLYEEIEERNTILDDQKEEWSEDKKKIEQLQLANEEIKRLKEEEKRLIKLCHEVVERYFKEHPDGPLVTLISYLDSAATTMEVINE